MGGLRRIAGVIACLGALAVAVLPLSAGAKETTPATEAGSTPPVFSWALWPKTLFHRELRPARVMLNYHAAAREPGENWRILRQLELHLDRNLEIHLRDYPACRPPRTDEPFDPVACRSALVGHGELKAEIPWLDPPILATSKVSVYKWRERHGATQLFAIAEITVPAPATVPILIEIRERQDGHYGSEASFHFPPIAADTGSISSFVLHIGKGLGYTHTPLSIISARCPRGHLQLSARMEFSDGTEAEEKAVQPCHVVKEAG